MMQSTVLKRRQTCGMICLLLIAFDFWCRSTPVKSSRLHTRSVPDQPYPSVVSYPANTPYNRKVLEFLLVVPLCSQSEIQLAPKRNKLPFAVISMCAVPRADAITVCTTHIIQETIASNCVFQNSTANQLLATKLELLLTHHHLPVQPPRLSAARLVACLAA
jgi:hypothetical protein